MKEYVDTLILDGTLVAMDDRGTILEKAGIAIEKGYIVAVNFSEKLRDQFSAEQVIDAKHKVIMPGLIDTYGHAGHGLIRGLYHQKHGWPAGQFYWHATTDDWWYAEALLGATERLRFGVTTGVSIIGSTPARADSPIFAIRNAEAYSKVGVRVVLGVGPPDLFVPHISEPWSGSFFEDGIWIEKPFTYDDAVANSVKVIKKWHNGADGRIRIALHPPYFFGRHNILGQTRYKYTSEDIPVMIEKAEEMRELADKYRVQIHTYLFGGSVDFALQHFGRERVEGLLGSDVVVEHGNGLNPNEVEVLGKTRCNVATAPSTGENIWYGYAPIIELLEAGANVTITSDGSAPLFSFDLWKDIQRAMWHQWITYKSRARVLPVGKALRMVTIDAALALGIDNEVGSLEAGKKADVILVDFNSPHLTPKTFVPNLLAYYVNGNDVDTVLVDGTILMEGKQILSVDKHKVLELARNESERAFDVISVEPYKEVDREFWHSARFSSNS